MEELGELLRSREGLYAQAHVTVDTEDRRPETIAEELVAGLTGGERP
jgi:hypothetical protein